MEEQNCRRWVGWNGFANRVSARSSRPLVSRERDPDEAWRIAGSGTLTAPRPARSCARSGIGAIGEAQQADRPSFHILQNSAMIEAAKQFVEGRRRSFGTCPSAGGRGFLAAAQAGLELPESAWPQRPARGPANAHARFRQEGGGVAPATRSSRERAGDRSCVHRAPQHAGRHRGRSEPRAKRLLVPWQRELLGL